jgi:hypothetical protein
MADSALFTSWVSALSVLPSLRATVMTPDIVVTVIIGSAINPLFHRVNRNYCFRLSWRSPRENVTILHLGNPQCPVAWPPVIGSGLWRNTLQDGDGRNERRRRH